VYWRSRSNKGMIAGTVTWRFTPAEWSLESARTQSRPTPISSSKACAVPK